MKYFGTAFSLTLAGLRLRIQIDLEDVPEESTATHHVGIPVRKKETASRN
jgi:hypothetical protein